jgi:hypothetical protein
MSSAKMFCSFNCSVMVRVLFTWLTLATFLSGAPQAAYADEAGPTWAQLSKAEQSVLQPLAPHWVQIDATRKEKWRDVAARFPQMTAEQQIRARERMADWSSMSIDERSAARLRFQESKQLTPTEREARWKAYLALPEEQRKALAKKPASTAPQPNLSPSSANAAANAKSSTSSALNSAQPKSNLTLPPPTASASLRPVSPGSVQATSGLSTRSITTRPEPPLHQQVGQPKIASGAASGTSFRSGVKKSLLPPVSGASVAGLSHTASAPRIEATASAASSSGGGGSMTVQ